MQPLGENAVVARTREKEEEGIAMNTSMPTILDLDVMGDSCFFAAPIDLDYDEPNAVVEDDAAVEFVSPAASAISAVELPVAVTVIDEPVKPVTVATVATVVPVIRRTAA
jgi:hypothetical protein